LRVLIIEDDPAMAALLQQGLQEEYHVVSSALDGKTGLDLATSYEFDVIILDWMLPGIDGIEVTRRLRTMGNVSPVLMLTALDTIVDAVKALDVGADDYLAKPFNFAELLARLRALARRPMATVNSKILKVADLSVYPETRRVFRGEHELRLTPTEYKLLEFLMCRPGVVASRRAIVEAVWGIGVGSQENTLDAFVRLLRNKLAHGKKQRLIHTVRGVGYCLRETPHAFYEHAPQK
jgi:DNA-binding response OmpR family regulator